MSQITYYSTNNRQQRVNFETALLEGQPKDFGLYMLSKTEIPRLAPTEISSMRGKSYAEIAFTVLNKFLDTEIPSETLEALLNDAYKEEKVPTEVQHVTGKTHILWLTKGPTYSFKDYAARFFGRTLNHFLGQRKIRRTVVVATSGDTGGAVADALYGLKNVDNIVFFPKGSISEGQRRQMTTLSGNIYAFEVNGDFDVCQALAKNLLGDKEFARQAFGDIEALTSANSISVGRLLPQAVYPFFAYSRISDGIEPYIASIPSGNFGDMMGTIIARQMGLPISRILCGVNENTEFPDFLNTGRYVVQSSKSSPSSAMIVSNPSNLARLIDFYGGHMFDERDLQTRKIIREGIIDQMPNMSQLRQHICSMSVTNDEHYQTMKEVYDKHGIILDPHGAVGWKTLDTYLGRVHDSLAVVYETADPGKFPQDVFKAIGIYPEIPEGIRKQVSLVERTYSIESKPDITDNGSLKLSDAQIQEAKEKIQEMLPNQKRMHQ